MRECSVEGCGRKHFGHGFCNAHYLKWYRHGDPEWVDTAHGTPTHCRNGHERTPENVYYSTLKDGTQKRQCRLCTRATQARFTAKMTPKERQARAKSFPSYKLGKHYQRKYKYGLSKQQVLDLLAVQGGRCGICLTALDIDSTDKMTKVNIDHDGKYVFKTRTRDEGLPLPWSRLYPGSRAFSQVR